MQGRWLGDWQGEWLGDGAPAAPGALFATLIGRGTLTATLTGSMSAPPPENGPSGGANWTRGYKPKHDYLEQRRRNKRDELLFIGA